MAVTLEAVVDGRTQSAAAVITSDGATWTWPDLFAQFAPAIRSFAASRGASSPDDIVQDVFATAVERFPLFEGDSSGLRSFFFTLAYRRVADEHRSVYRRQEHLVADHAPTADDDADIEVSITDIEAATEAMKALEILSERERRVIELRIIDEATPAEVADALGLSNGNVRVIQARALMKIRKYLEGRSGSMPSLTLVFAFVKALRSKLPASGGLAEWIEMIQAESTRGMVKTTAAGAGSALAVEAASLGAIAGSILKIGLVVALATATTSAGAADAGNQQAQPLGNPVPVAPVVADSEPTGFNVPPAVVDSPSPEPAIAPNTPNRPDIVPPVKTEEEPPSALDGEETAPEPDPDAKEPGAEPEPAGSTGTNDDGVLEPIVDGVVEPVVETVEVVVDTVVDTVNTVVDDVVKPVVDTVVDAVDDTTNTVTDTVDTVVDDTTNVVDDTVDTVVDDVNSVLDDVNDGLGGLLG